MQLAGYSCSTCRWQDAPVKGWIVALVLSLDLVAGATTQRLYVTVRSALTRKLQTTIALPCIHALCDSSSKMTICDRITHNTKLVTLTLNRAHQPTLRAALPSFKKRFVKWLITRPSYCHRVCQRTGGDIRHAQPHYMYALEFPDCIPPRKKLVCRWRFAVT